MKFDKLIPAGVGLVITGLLTLGVASAANALGDTAQLDPKGTSVLAWLIPNGNDGNIWTPGQKLVTYTPNSNDLGLYTETTAALPCGSYLQIDVTPNAVVPKLTAPGFTLTSAGEDQAVSWKYLTTPPCVTAPPTTPVVTTPPVTTPPVTAPPTTPPVTTPPVVTPPVTTPPVVVVPPTKPAPHATRPAGTSTPTATTPPPVVPSSVSTPVQATHLAFTGTHASIELIIGGLILAAGLVLSIGRVLYLARRHKTESGK